jgi:transketolase
MVYKESYTFQIGKAVVLREGTDVALIGTGTVVHTLLKVAELLDQESISCSVINMHTIKPLDIEAINNVLNAKTIVTVEEHTIIGGLGSAVAEYMAPLKKRPPQLILGIPDAFGKAGEYNWLLEKYGFTSNGITASIKKFLMGGGG